MLTAVVGEFEADKSHPRSPELPTAAEVAAAVVANEGRTRGVKPAAYREGLPRERHSRRQRISGQPVIGAEGAGENAVRAVDESVAKSYPAAGRNPDPHFKIHSRSEREAAVAAMSREVIFDEAGIMNLRFG
jgi:hypothetical protein